MQITIPKAVVKLLELEPEDLISFVYDADAKQVFISKIGEIVSPNGLSFSISKESVKKLLEKEKSGE